MMSEIIPKTGERVEKAARFVPTSRKLLDVGCGDGILIHFIKNRVSEVYGIDNLSPDLQKAKKRGLITKLVNLDKEKLPFNNNTFDVVTCLDVIEHVKDPSIMLKEIYRVLKKNGVIILSTPNIRFSDHLFALIFKGIFPKTSISEAEYDGGHIHFFTYKDLHILFKAQRFMNIQDEEIINKQNRGWKGKLFRLLLGEKFMKEFRTPGILLIAKK